MCKQITALIYTTFFLNFRGGVSKLQLLHTPQFFLISEVMCKQNTFLIGCAHRICNSIVPRISPVSQAFWDAASTHSLRFFNSSDEKEKEKHGS